jgi:tetratricopeptide (TPR) repeat protein
VTALSSILVALTLNVPFLPQTPALCGGAAVAMVFRYYGDRHADVQQFEPLVDRGAEGIASDVLVAAVRQRRWRAEPLAGSIDLLRERISAGTPLVLLVEDRPGRYHYVVAVGADEDAIVVHDPTWGPFRRHPLADLTRRWAAAKYWALLIEPDGATRETDTLAILKGSPYDQPTSAGAAAAPQTRCDQLLDQAVEEIGRSGLSAADTILARVIGECPRSAAPIAELAGIRFAQERWNDAEALAERAAALDQSYAYAWDVLGSARFVQDDAEGALDAWNEAGKPQIDSLVIDGLSRTRYALVAQFAGLEPNTLLTARAYRLAERRLRELPDQLAVRVGYTPEPDGYVTVRVALAERAARPQWLTVGAHAAIGREVRASLPGWSGQGEVWSGAWRWWPRRPRVALDFTAPDVGFLRGVSRVSGAWERQTYTGGAGAGQPILETRSGGAFATADWLAPDFRYELAAGIDSWNDTRRTGSVRAALQRRFLGDRLALEASGEYFSPISEGPHFADASVGGAFRTSRRDAGLVHTIRGGFDTASTHAPLALWSGAGDGMARTHLLRAHPLLVDDIISGPAFGRSLLYVTAESTRWLAAPRLVRLGLAAFADAAEASRRLNDGSMMHVDAGAGVRLRLPGAGRGMVRADYAIGLRDGNQRVSVGIVGDRF